MMSTTLYNNRYQYKNLCRLISTGKVFNNHYEILNLSKDCSTKEIKDSFIKLSKEHHPDVNKSKDSHKTFLQINEAYKVLSKTESRRLYDLGYSTPITQDGNVEVHHRGNYRSDPWKDPSFYGNRNKSEDQYYENKPYYGIKGLKRVSNLTVVLFCISLTFIGVGLQVMVIRNSFTFKRGDLIRKSNEAEDALRDVRQAASLNGNEMQLELLKLRFKNSATNKSTFCSEA